MAGFGLDHFLSFENLRLTCIEVDDAASHLVRHGTREVIVSLVKLLALSYDRVSLVTLIEDRERCAVLLGFQDGVLIDEGTKYLRGRLLIAHHNRCASKADFGTIRKSLHNIAMQFVAMRAMGFIYNQQDIWRIIENWKGRNILFLLLITHFLNCDKVDIVFAASKHSPGLGNISCSTQIFASQFHCAL